MLRKRRVRSAPDLIVTKGAVAMAVNRLMSVVQAAGYAMAPSEEYLDGPSNVMPRAQFGTFGEAGTMPAGSSALTISWSEPARTQRLRDLVGTYWYGRATPA